jgi:hypothetical protein
MSLVQHSSSKPLRRAGTAGDILGTARRTKNCGILHRTCRHGGLSKGKYHAWTSVGDHPTRAPFCPLAHDDLTQHPPAYPSTPWHPGPTLGLDCSFPSRTFWGYLTAAVQTLHAMTLGKQPETEELQPDSVVICAKGAKQRQANIGSRMICFRTRILSRIQCWHVHTQAKHVWEARPAVCFDLTIIVGSVAPATLCLLQRLATKWKMRTGLWKHYSSGNPYACLTLFQAGTPCLRPTKKYSHPSQ